jgi:hypothetical protein
MRISQQRNYREHLLQHECGAQFFLIPNFTAKI